MCTQREMQDLKQYRSGQLMRACQQITPQLQPLFIILGMAQIAKAVTQRAQVAFQVLPQSGQAECAERLNKEMVTCWATSHRLACKCSHS